MRLLRTFYGQFVPAAPPICFDALFKFLNLPYTNSRRARRARNVSPAY
jgi:hypothetical protein